MGNRIGKSFTENSQTAYTWNVRDAQGNTMATYEQKTVENEQELRLIELPIYGSSRLGMLQPNKLLNSTATVTNTFAIGHKQYEISNHLGNVLTTISDSKQAIDDGQGQVAYYKPIVKTQQDYYPFGMLMPERQFTLGNEDYRYGFNGQERSDEVYGKGNLNTALFWEYDTRLGRRWNLDPVDQISFSNYAVFNLYPVNFIDILGDIVKHSKFRDKINSTIARIFNKEFRKKYRKWKSDELTYTIEKTEKITKKLIESKPTEDILNEGDFNIYYSEIMDLGDVSNPITRNSVFAIGSGLKIGNFITMIPGLIVNGIISGNKGWGFADRIQTLKSKINVLSWGFGNYNKYNVWGGELGKGIEKPIKIRPSDGLIGFRIGVGKIIPLNFIDIGGQIVTRKYEIHLHINAATKSKRKKELGSREAIFDFRTRK